MQLFSADCIFLTPKKWKNQPQKLLIIGPDPFISQSSPNQSPQPRTVFSYYEMSGPASVLLSVIPTRGGQIMPTIYLGHHNFWGRCYNCAPKSAAYSAGKKSWFYHFWMRQKNSLKSILKFSWAEQVTVTCSNRWKFRMNWWINEFCYLEK